VRPSTLVLGAMERSAADEDLVTCPGCGVRDALTIRWVPDIDRRVHERTEVGCARCDRWSSAKEDRWAFAEWNVLACDEWAQNGTTVPHAQLYRLLHEASTLERAQHEAIQVVSQYLSEQIAAACPWHPRDRFESLARPRGIWSVTAVEAVYGTNTGPFCIISARAVFLGGCPR
jgi:hypothetical protein